MNTKKDFDRAAKIVNQWYKIANGNPQDDFARKAAVTIRESFVSFFRGDNLRFDAERFRDACEKDSH